MEHRFALPGANGNGRIYKQCRLLNLRIRYSYKTISLAGLDYHVHQVDTKGRFVLILYGFYCPSLHYCRSSDLISAILYQPRCVSISSLSQASSCPRSLLRLQSTCLPVQTKSRVISSLNANRTIGQARFPLMVELQEFHGQEHLLLTL